jgi:hypothetical protein
VYVSQLYKLEVMSINGSGVLGVRWSVYCSQNVSCYQYWHAQINLLCLFSLCSEVWSIFFGGGGGGCNLSNNKLIFLKRKLLELWLIQNTESTQKEVDPRKILRLSHEHILSLINFSVYNLEHFQTNFADLIQGMISIFIVQLPNFSVLREVQTMHVVYNIISELC